MGAHYKAGQVAAYKATHPLTSKTLVEIFVINLVEKSRKSAPKTAYNTNHPKNCLVL